MVLMRSYMERIRAYMVLPVIERRLRQGGGGVLPVIERRLLTRPPVLRSETWYRYIGFVYRGTARM